jgi:hypothetical protein
VYPCHDSEASFARNNIYCLVFPDAKSAVEWREAAFKPSSRVSQSRRISLKTARPVSGDEEIVKTWALGPIIRHTVEANSYLRTLGRMFTDDASEQQESNLKSFTEELRARLTTAKQLGSQGAVVLLRAPGVQTLELDRLVQSLLFDSQRLNMLWDVLLGGKVLGLGVSRETGNEAVKPGVTTLGQVLALAEEVDSEEISEADSLMRFPDSPRKMNETTWLLPFSSRSGAKRFVKDWNNQPMPVPSVQSSSLNQQMQPKWKSFPDQANDIIIHAEMLEL